MSSKAFGCDVDVTFSSSDLNINRGGVSSSNVNVLILFLLRVVENDFPFTQASPS